MDLFSILQTVWRHKLATLPVMILTVVLAVYVVAIKAPVYEAKASYLLINPPAPPTQAQIQHDPQLADINTDNPYTRFGDLTIVAGLISQEVTSDQARATLVNEGADPRYDVAPNVQMGSAIPIVEITGVGATSQGAIQSANIVSRAVLGRLRALQVAQHVDSRYLISTLPVDLPDRAQLQTSGKVRSLIAVLALGSVLLFVVVSVMKAWEERRASTRPVHDEDTVVWPRDSDEVLGPDDGVIGADLEMTPFEHASTQSVHSK